VASQLRVGDLQAGLQRRDGSKIGKEVADIEALGFVDKLRIAELAADGLTNREIAQTLFVTSRTVEGHLTHVFDKLGVKDRSGLPAALAAPTQAVRA
jgi:FixJ family two-component response regulator